jgi:hypothetical protein
VNEIRHERAMECEMKQLDTGKSREGKLTRKIMAMRNTRNMKKRNPREHTNHHSAELQNYNQLARQTQLNSTRKMKVDL